MEETISLGEIFSVIKKRIFVILASACIFLGLAAVVTFVIITPKYQSSAQLIVKLPKGADGRAAVDINDVNANLTMINTYKDFITTSNSLAEEAQKRLVSKGLFQGSPADIKQMIDVTQAQNSQMFTISATSDNAYEARDVATTVAEVFQKQAKKVVDVDKVSIIAKNELNLKPISPNVPLNLLLGVILGVIVGIGWAFLLEIFDKTVKDDRFFQETLELPVLGVVPAMNMKESNYHPFKGTTRVERRRRKEKEASSANSEGGDENVQP